MERCAISQWKICDHMITYFQLQLKRAMIGRFETKVVWHIFQLATKNRVTDEKKWEGRQAAWSSAQPANNNTECFESYDLLQSGVAFLASATSFVMWHQAELLAARFTTAYFSADIIIKRLIYWLVCVFRTAKSWQSEIGRFVWHRPTYPIAINHAISKSKRFCSKKVRRSMLNRLRGKFFGSIFGRCLQRL